MNKKSMHSNLLKVFIFMFILSFIVIFGGTYIIKNIEENEVENYKEKFKAEMMNYKLQLDRKIEGNFKTIRVLSNFISSYSEYDYEDIRNRLRNLDIDDNLVKITILNKDYDIIISNIYNEDSKEVSYTNLDKNFNDILDKTIQGKEVISDIYYDENLKEEVVILSTPIYSEKEVSGVITMTISISEFENILKESKYGSYGFIDMVDNKGNILILSDKGVKRNKIYNIFESPYITEKHREAIEESLSQNKEQYDDILYNGIRYGVYFIPLDYNDWYLSCVSFDNIMETLNYRTTKILEQIFIILSILVIVFAILSYKIIKKNDKELKKLAYFDSLTESYNCTKFKLVISELLKENKYYYLISLNIKNFHFINEEFGKENADKLLRYIAKVLNNNIDEKECFCHSFSDIFLMLVKSEDENLLVKRLNNIKNEINKFKFIENNEYEIKINSGIVNCKDIFEENKNFEDNKYIESIISYATFALKEAKKLESEYKFYGTKSHEEGAKINYIESNMRKALENNEFKLFLQPKMDLKTNTILGAEALVRWIKDDGTMIYPNDFIPLFEKNGFCVDLDLYMVEQVCKKLREWIDKGEKAIPISINQSKKLFYLDNYVDRIDKIIKKYNIPSKYIVLEILESLAIENVGNLNKTIKKLHEKGLKVSMDDFGNGYSSLNSLTLLEIDEIKLDCMFLRNLEYKNKDKQAIVMKNIIHIAKEMNILTVAEGVETKEDERLLKNINCDYSQGYLYSKPISVKEFEEKYL